MTTGGRSARRIPVFVASLAAALGARAGACGDEQMHKPVDLTPGAIREMTIEPRSAVLTAWLGNGVAVHHRSMGFLRNTAFVSITVEGGLIEETEKTRGLSRAAGAAFRRGAAASAAMSNDEFQKVLASHGLSYDADVQRDALLITLSGPVSGIEPGLRAVSSLLAEPRVVEQAFDAWRRSEVESLEARATQPRWALFRAVTDEIFAKDEPRGRPTQAGEVAAMQRERVERWAQEWMSRASIESSVVGDMPRPAALGAMVRTLGTLPARQAPSPERLAPLRKITRMEAPIDRTVEVAMSPAQSLVFLGCYSPGRVDDESTTRLWLASRVLRNRLRTLASEDGPIYYVSVDNASAQTFDGLGLFQGAASVRPGIEEKAARLLREAFDALAEDGPTAQELERAKEEERDELAEEEREPSTWAKMTSDLLLRGRSPTWILDRSVRIGNATADEVRDAFREIWSWDRRIRVVVKPDLPAR